MFLLTRELSLAGEIIILQALAMQTEHLSRSIQTLMLAVTVSLGGQKKEGQKYDGMINGKHFRTDPFTGNQAQWDDWAFVFKRCVRSQSLETYKTMTEWETSEEDIDEEAELEDAVKKRSRGLYDVLC